VTGTTEGLQRLIDAARGKKTDNPDAEAEAEGSLERLLESVRELPADQPPASPDTGSGAPKQPEESPAALQPGETEKAGGRTSQLPLDAGDGQPVGVADPREFAEGATDAESVLAQTSDPQTAVLEAGCPVWMLVLVPALIDGRKNRTEKQRPKLPLQPELWNDV